MERFHIKVTFVFIVTIILPSLLLCFFALQTVKTEQKQQGLQRRALTAKHTENSARKLNTAFQKTRDRVVNTLTEIQPRCQNIRDALTALKSLTLQEDMLRSLILIDKSGRRRYPAPQNRDAQARFEHLRRPLNVGALASLGGGAGLQQGYGEDAIIFFENAKQIFRDGQTQKALDMLRPLLEDQHPEVYVSAALESARMHFSLDQVETAQRLLEQQGLASLSTLGPLRPEGTPVAAWVRIELATLYRQQGKENLAQTVINSLIRDLKSSVADLPPNFVDEIIRRACLNLDLPKSLFDNIRQRRRQIETEMEQLTIVFGRDLQRELRSRAAKPSGQRSPFLRADYFKHRTGNTYEVLLFASVFGSSGQVLGLCGFVVDLPLWTQSVLDAFLEESNQLEPDLRLVATNPLFANPEAKAHSDESKEPAVTRLAEPLEHIEIRCYQKKVTKAIRLSNEQARLNVWLITVAMVGIVLGVLVTAYTVRREAHSSQLKTDFVANVTHELKTPLTSIRLFIETLELDHIENEEERKECLSIMARETERLSRLIDRLLAFSRLDRHKWKFRLTYENPSELIKEALALYKNQRGHEHIDVDDVEVESLQNPRIACDREAMIEVIFNLIHNAFKYTPAKDRRIRITVAERRRDVTISVIDNGVGVPSRDRKRIFQKFERGQYAEKAQIQGSGIGLTLARSIVRGHGGELAYAPNKNRGSRFIITVPK